MPKAAASLVGDIRRWIVCVDDRDAAAAVRAGADELVVLTSADQLALVEAYRLVKAARARAVDPSALELGVVIAGANEKASERAASLLEEMSERHLGTSLPVIAMVRRLDVVEHSQRIAFEESLRGDPAEVVIALRDAVEAEPSQTPVMDAEDPTPWLRLAEADVEPDGDLEDLLRDLEYDEIDAQAFLELEVDPNQSDPNQSDPARSDPSRDEFDAIFADDPSPEIERSSPAPRSTRAIDAGRQRPRVPSPIRLGPAPIQPADRPAFIGLEELDGPGADAASRIGPLQSDRLSPAAPLAGSRSASIVEPKSAPGDLLSAIAGLTEVDWPFINAEGVRCAVDAEGRLHLLCRDLDHGQLGVARSWAEAQARQLSKCAGISEDAARHPVLHVVTDHAPRVANLHRTGVHLHLVVEGEGGRFAVPLNDDGNRDMR
jgi:hypothetical protein